jgi:hypothetical protein
VAAANRCCSSISPLASSLKASLSKACSSVLLFAANSNRVVNFILTSNVGDRACRGLCEAAFARKVMAYTFGRNIWRSVTFTLAGLMAFRAKKRTIKRPRAAGISIMCVDEKMRLMAAAETNAALVIEKKLKGKRYKDKERGGALHPTQNQEK